MGFVEFACMHAENWFIGLNNFKPDLISLFYLLNHNNFKTNTSQITSLPIDHYTYWQGLLYTNELEVVIGNSQLIHEVDHFYHGSFHILEFAT